MGVEEGREINRIKKGAEKQVRRAKQHIGNLELGLVKLLIVWIFIVAVLFFSPNLH